MSFLLKALLADRNQPLPEHQRAKRMTALWLAMVKTREPRGAAFADWELITEAVNYVLGFIKKMEIDTDITDDQILAAQALYAMSQRTPLAFNEVEYNQVFTVLQYYQDLLEVATGVDLLAVENYINHECEAAKIKQLALLPFKRSKRSHRKPKKVKK